MLRARQATWFQLCVIAVVIAPQVPYVPAWCTALALAVLLWRAWLAWKGRALPGRWVPLAGLVLVLVATLASHGTLLGRDAGMTLIVALLALKTLELHAKRDAFVVFFLGFFVLLSQFLNSQSLLTALLMLMGCAGLLTGLVNAQLLQGQAGIKTAGRQALGLMVWGAPVMVLLFVLFPRIAPIWGVPGGGGARSGLTEDMTVGRIASLVLSEQVAFRVRFEGAQPEPADLYFRGPVLSQWDGTTWRAGMPPQGQPQNQSESPISPLAGGQAPLSYDMLLEPHQNTWLLTLDATVQAPVLSDQTVPVGRQLEWRSAQPLTQALRYQAKAYIANQWREPLSPAQRHEALFLPPQSNPRTLALASSLRADPRYQNADATTWVGVVMERLAQQGYRYTLAPGLSSAHTADTFWFDLKEGFCEHMASSFVILMRALGVPARVVTGYQGGERNAADGHWVVRQSDAHAWAEVWVPEANGLSGAWLRVDPSAVVAPARLQGRMRLKPEAGLAIQVAREWLGMGEGLAWWASVGHLWEAVQYQWQQKILDFGQASQLQLLQALGFESPALQDLAWVLAACIALAAGAYLVFTRWSRQGTDPWQVLWQRVVSDLGKAGLDLPLPLHSTPRQLAKRLGAWPPPQAAALQTWLQTYELARYGRGDVPAPSVAALARQWRHLSRHLSPPS